MSASRIELEPGVVRGEFFAPLADGRVRCDLCPRGCILKDGQRAFCFVRAARGQEVVLTTYGRSTGFCVDPIEKKPLCHFYPGSAVLSFGTAGCNLGCRFCQNWGSSRARQVELMSETATPEAIAAAAVASGSRSVAFTYNDPVIFHEYAVDTAIACQARGVKTVAVTAGYISAAARERFFAHIDAANVDLKAFDERFYHKLAAGHLAPVLDTLRYLRHETSVWLEITTLLIPGENDSVAEIQALSEWVAENLGPDVPLHFSAFHPDYKLLDRPPTPAATLSRARTQAKGAGLRYVYTGNVHDPEGQSTRCPSCAALVIGRDGYDVGTWGLKHGACAACGTEIAGRFDALPGTWGSRRLPVRLSG
ncbi:MAG: AmmeMemoRadiSam system radical SAM enzyme [Deltaproteobacteria bacterium]|nr:AmmeMemoRadiSam system radical SAM enzyme [Deltaproteobacteria bacterium]